jgi:hypothetical protein
MHATRLPIPAAANGPFPHGCMLAVYVDTLTNQTIQVNGFRVGLLNAPLSQVLLSKPATVYHSKSPIAAGKTTVISLAAHLPTGANGAIYTAPRSRGSCTPVRRERRFRWLPRRGVRTMGGRRTP